MLGHRGLLLPGSTSPRPVSLKPEPFRDDPPATLKVVAVTRGEGRAPSQEGGAESWSRGKGTGDSVLPRFLDRTAILRAENATPNHQA
mmetsp:Transcript_88840/g.176656  ORF Transcript_88840/g.176656 Transcript_88840/m.176656 type:complete len:88 (+) Transcript_88840:1973-2236(+)